MTVSLLAPMRFACGCACFVGGVISINIARAGENDLWKGTWFRLARVQIFGILFFLGCKCEAPSLGERRPVANP